MINAGFESFSGLLMLLNCRALYRDKGYQGINIVAQVGFTAWGFWNLFYYPHLGQWMSFCGGLVLVLANVLWIALAFYYGKAKKAL